MISGIKKRNISRSTTACTTPATGVRPPLVMLVIVRAMAPVTGIPPKKGTEGGSAVGARYLADYYFDNDDPDRALSWLSKAADLGDTRARTELARA